MSKKITVWYLILLVVALFMAAWIGVNFHNQSENFNRNIQADKLTDYQVNEDSALEMTIRLKLPQSIREGDAVAFYTRHQNLTAAIDGNEVYHLQAGNNTFGSTPGVTWNFIPLGLADAGKEIVIHQKSAYKESAGEVPEFLVGPVADIYQQIITRNAPSFILCILIFLCGIMFIVYWAIMRRKTGIDYQLLFLGMFAVMLGCWSANETLIVPLLARGFVLPAYWSFLSLMFMMIPFVLFVKGLYRDKEHFAWYFLCFFSLFDICVCMGLQLLNIADFRQTLLLTHFTMLLFFAVIVIMTIRELRAGKITEEMKVNVICIFIDIAGLLLDLTAYYLKSGDSNIFGRVCFLIYIVVLGLLSSKKSLELMRRGREAEIYQYLAFYDQLTGIGNRTAYARDLMEWQEQKKQDVGIIMMDLNDLKKCNDTYGHAEGDRYIIAAVSALQQCFEGEEKCYRIGGDEFCIIAPRLTDERVKDAIEKMQKIIDKYNEGKHGVHMSIAWGCAYYDRKNDKNLDDTIARADEAMYQRKMEMKGGGTR